MTQEQTQDIVRKLNELLRVLEDGKTGFAQAAEQCEGPDLRSLMKDCAEDCARAVNPLQKVVQSYGEDAVNSGSATGAVREGWIKLKTSIVADSTQAAVDAAEQQHQRVQTAFSDVLDDAELPPAVRKVVKQEQAVAERNLARLALARRGLEANAGS